MAVVTLLPDASRGPFQSPDLNVPDGNPRHVEIVLTSPTFGSNSALNITITVEQSFNDGVDWEPWFAAGGPGGRAGTITKGGAVSDGLLRTMVQFDGLPRKARVFVVPNTTFVWGLTAEIKDT